MSSAGRAIVFASDLDNRWNDFPLHATFVPFIHEVIQYLSGGRRSSDYVIAQVPAGVPAVPGVAPFIPVPGAAPRLVAVNVDPGGVRSEPADGRRISDGRESPAGRRGGRSNASKPDNRKRASICGSTCSH